MKNTEKWLSKLPLRRMISIWGIPKYPLILGFLASMIYAEDVVGVALFDGNPNYTHQATNLFAEGLYKLGYTVIDRSYTEKLIKELKYQSSGMVEDGHQPGEQQPVDYLFVGNVSIVIDPHVAYVNSYVNIRMIDVRTGEVTWHVNAKDPRLFTWVMDLNSSVKHAIKSALKSFKGRAK